VLKQELLLAYAKGDCDEKLSQFRRDMLMLPETATIYQAFQKMLARRVQISAVVDEYGSLEGLVTLEDLLETLLGEEIVDEADKTADRQALARRLWRWRSKRYGLKVDETAQAPDDDSGEQEVSAEEDPRESADREPPNDKSG
jgi:CBS domain containing-hemolysin-like protein